MDMHYLMCDRLNRNNASYIVGVSHLKKKSNRCTTTKSWNAVFFLGWQEIPTGSATCKHIPAYFWPTGAVRIIVPQASLWGHEKLGNKSGDIWNSFTHHHRIGGWLQIATSSQSKKLKPVETQRIALPLDRSSEKRAVTTCPSLLGTKEVPGTWDF